MQSVVAISAQGDEGRRRNGEAERASGTGFVIDAAGLILTNAHVVAKVDTVEVTFSNGRKYSGAVIGRDGRTDLAVIRITPDVPLTALKFAASSRRPLGTRVFALGNPLGKNFSVSSGVIGGYDRAYDVVWPVNFIQHDAALNPGNSGGPLITETGEVIGINTATPPETLFDIGISLAIPIEQARTIAPELIASGKIARGRLGVSASSADAGMAAALGAPGVTGLIVDSVAAGGSAERAGIKIGDLLLSVDGKPLEIARDLTLALLASRPGDTVTVRIARGKQRDDVRVALEADDDRAGERGRSATLSLSDGMGADGIFTLGVEFRRDPAGGVAIARISEGSIARSYGLYENDIVIAIDGVAFDDPEAARVALAATGKDIAVLRVRRVDQGTFHVALPLTAEAAARRRPGVPRRLPQGPL